MKIKHEAFIRDILSLDQDTIISRNQDMDEFNWDSLAMVILQTVIDENYNIQIDPDSLPVFKTIGSLDDYINSFK